MAETPAALGYRMPAEWETHDATWLSWPKDPNTFPPEIIGEVEETFARMVKALAEGEEVRIMVDDEKSEAHVRAKIGSQKNVAFLRLRTADVWTRDYAPICLRGKDVALTKWAFNAWGGKYEDLLPDDAAGKALASASGMSVFEPGLVLEGGSIDVNGRGTLITTEQCLLNPNRNPQLGRADVEAALKGYFGVGRIVWLGSGIIGDDTDGHVDDIARFLNPDTVAMAWEGDPSDPNHSVLAENMRRLRKADDDDDDILDIVTIRMPEPVLSGGGRLPASHLNFYIGNSAVLVPTFGSPSDSDAIGTLKPFFAGREVMGIDCRSLVYGLGAIHCVTQQVPSSSPA